MPDGIVIRPGTLKDAGFIDQMQKIFKGHLGFLYSGTIEKKISTGDVLVAVDSNDVPYGFIMGTQSYDRNDQVSRIDQIGVVPMKQRRQVGGALLAEWINRLPYGVLLICCWCAQDLREGRFWEAQGFLPLAFRAGGQTQGRVHIFWERRVRSDDVQTPFWFPKETSNGAMAAARLILPLPPGTDWREVELPRILPSGEATAGPRGALLPNGLPVPTALPGGAAARTRTTGSAVLTPAEFAAAQRQKSKHLQERRPPGVKCAGRYLTEQPPPPPPVEKKAPKPRAKNVPEHVVAARELRDRFLEQLNTLGITEQGRYDPSRALSAAPSSPIVQELMSAVTGKPHLRLGDGE
jgi:hypothetical protein